MQNDDVAQQIQDILQKHKVKYSYSLDFPRYRILPDEVRLAMSVLQAHGMKIQFTLIPDESETPE